MSDLLPILIMGFTMWAIGFYMGYRTAAREIATLWPKAFRAWLVDQVRRESKGWHK